MAGDVTLADRVNEVLAVDPDEFRDRVRADADLVKSALREGTFDNYQSVVGLEYEFFAVANGRWQASSRPDECTLMRVPRRMLQLIGFEPELGLHNAEMTVTPQPLSNAGLRAQEAEVRARLNAAADCTRPEGMRLVSDGIWKIPPIGEAATDYLTDSVDVNGTRIATNMSDAIRYHAMGNGDAVETATMEAPGVSLEADTVMPESLITSIQPHYQVAHASELPTYFDYALRIAGPLLAIAANSPLFPPDLYHDHWTGEDILEQGWAENRIPVFESVLNTFTDDEKVAFPEGFDSVGEAVDRIVRDSVFIPMPADDGTRFDDTFATFTQKHGTYWRWIRPVFDGATQSAANARIEFRILPAQPTLRDTMALQAAFAGLMEELSRQNHPVIDLSWAQANENFYAAARDGIQAELEWVHTDGYQTRDNDVIYTDVLDQAVAGLQVCGCDEKTAEQWIAPLRWRVDQTVSPASWKRTRLRDRLAADQSLREAIHGTHRDYIDNQSASLTKGNFSDWKAD